MERGSLWEVLGVPFLWDGLNIMTESSPTVRIGGADDDDDICCLKSELGRGDSAAVSLDDRWTNIPSRTETCMFSSPFARNGERSRIRILSAVREALSGFHSFGRFHNYYDRFRHSGVRKDEAQNEAR